MAITKGILVRNLGLLGTISVVGEVKIDVITVVPTRSRFGN